MNIGEGMVLYLATAAGGTTVGQIYDGTDVTTLPFSADLTVYARDGYTTRPARCVGRDVGLAGSDVGRAVR